MTEHLVPLSFQQLIQWTMMEYARENSIFNIPAQCFFIPDGRPDYATRRFGSELLTPVGPAAGPHTQMAQNIITAWLTGSRFIELKTVQIMDELEIPRPCIDMTDEGYNVEWSQELKLRQSAVEYIHAWVMIHILRRMLKMESAPMGTIFNMSVGYDYQGVTSDPMRAFIEKMKNAEDEIDRIRQYLRVEYPAFADIEIPAQISNNVTVSTMHGCPPDEIEKLASFLRYMAKRARPSPCRHDKARCDDNAPNHLYLPMSRQDIADYLGLTIETVSRTLTQFQQTSAIELATSRRMILRNRQALINLDS